jgi:type IV pilus assembly protein PilA
MPVWLIVVLVSLVLLIVLIGTLALLAVTGMRKYIGAAKAAEAVNGVGMIARDGKAAYDDTGELCASASRPVPATIADVKGKKYMSTPSDWDADKATNAGFSCLKFEMSYPQYYQYDYQFTGSPSRATAGDSFRAIAHGDLNGDGVESEFTLSGSIVGKSVVLDPKPTETNPGE